MDWLTDIAISRATSMANKKGYSTMFEVLLEDANLA